MPSLIYLFTRAVVCVRGWLPTPPTPALTGTTTAPAWPSPTATRTTWSQTAASAVVLVGLSDTNIYLVMVASLWLANGLFSVLWHKDKPYEPCMKLGDFHKGLDLFLCTEGWFLLVGPRVLYAIKTRQKAYNGYSSTGHRKHLTGYFSTATVHYTINVLMSNETTTVCAGPGMTPAKSNTCWDKYSNCASLCSWYADDCKASCSADCK